MILDKISTRKPNLFEYILLAMGLLITAVGYFFIYNVVNATGITSYESAVSVLLWLMVVLLVILTAVNENSKEELKIMIMQQHDELKLLREDLRRKK